MNIIILAAVFAVAKAQFGFGNAPKLIPGVIRDPAAGAASAVVDNARGAANAVKDTASSIIDAAWGDFRTKFNRKYSSLDEELAAKQNYIANRAKVLLFNDNIGKSSFVQKLNGFADMLNSEFNKLLNGFNGKKAKASKATGTEYHPEPTGQVPKEVDWRTKGGVTPVKSQQKCAACWAFAAAGALEGHYFRKTGKLVEISPQNLIDCTSKYGNEGCKGGLSNPAFEYVRDNKGVNTLQGYPFEAKNGQCRYNKNEVGATDTGFEYIAEGDEKDLEKAVATLGPVAAAIDASQESFQFYSDGVYYDPKCSNEIDKLNHAVLVVGYGVEPDGQKYWLVKNSYGPEWGIGGYIKMAKDRGNHCGIATFATYPKI